MASKAQSIEAVQREISRLQHMCELVAMLPDDIPGQIAITGYSIQISIPADIATLRKVRRLIGREWKLIFAFESEEQGHRNFSFHLHGDPLGECLIIIMAPELEGATCRKVQTGVKNVPVYQVICN